MFATLLVSLNGCDVRPESVSAFGEGALTESDRPTTIATKFGAPGHQPKRRGMQRMLARKSDRAVDLMRDSGCLGNGNTGPDLGDRNEKFRIAPVEGKKGRFGSSFSGGDFLRQDRQVLLHRLLPANGASELLALTDINNRTRQHISECAGHLTAAHHGTNHSHRIIGKSVVPQRNLDWLIAKSQGIAEFAREIRSMFDNGAIARGQHDQSFSIVPQRQNDGIGNPPPWYAVD
jgi:hypothetical protein